MAGLTIRLPKEKRERVKELARQRGVSVNKLFEEWATTALAENDTRSWFEIRAKRGNPQRGLELLDKLDKHYGTNGAGTAE